MTLIYKIIPRALWEDATKIGRFDGAPIDITDGFIHFSSASQVSETANKHFKDQNDLLLLAVDPICLGEALRYEVSRGGALFPHLYASLKCDNVSSVSSFAPDKTGHFSFSET